jgi:uncharacterized protein YceK
MNLRMKNGVFIILFSFFLSSCGTIKSLRNDDQKVEIKHRHGRTKCDEISFVYSGVRYDLCLLHSDQKRAELQFQLDPLWLLTADLLLSVVADTVVLPYTVYKQIDTGNLKVVK